MTRRPALLLAAAALAGGGGYTWYARGPAAVGDAAATATTIPVTVRSADGRSHRFVVDRAATPAAQQQGLMYRTGIPADGGMLFWPYPPEGGAPRPAHFWMKNTPTPLDILFVRGDGTIARIAENAVPFSETLLSSEEPVAAVLEVPGGRAAALGIAEGDRVDWPGRGG